MAYPVLPGMPVSAPSPLERENSCTFLRLIFAFLVVWGHAYVLGGFGDEPLSILTRGAISGREIAVQGFFVLSGFLIAKSLGENPSLWRFACHRAFRIFPAFWAYLLLAVFIMAPTMLEVRWPDRFGYGQLLTLGPLSAWSYFTHNWALQAQEFLIAPLFIGNPERFQVNGSLWSVHYEAVFYVCAAAGAGAWSLDRRAAWLASALAVGVAFWSGSMVAAFVGIAFLWRAAIPRGWGIPALFVLLYTIEVVTACNAQAFAQWPRAFVLWLRFAFHPIWRLSGLAFLGGMLCWRFRAHVKWNVPAFLIAVGVLLAGICGQHWRLAMPLALPYVVLFLAARLPFQKMERWGDYSYGIYIFSFPIQQLLYFHGLHRAGLAAYLGGSLVLSLAAGVLSWWLLEKPALRLGRKLGAWKAWNGSRARNESIAVQLPLPMETTSFPAT